MGAAKKHKLYKPVRLEKTARVETARHKINRQVGLWFWWLALLVFAIVVIGGITRLTRSGLSITEWKPVAGILPPLSPEAWQSEFALYQKTPEYRHVNHGMSLDEFKGIYFWEYLHRLWGRLIGFAFIIPFIIFLIRGALNRRLIQISLFAFALGGAQGFLGWYMVKSGLSAQPSVSHYRLAAHLGLALFVMQYLFVAGYKLLVSDSRSEQASGRPSSKMAMLRLGQVALVLLCLQILWGAFVAGLKAGYAYNTFPKMGDAYIPNGLLAMTPWWHNFLESNLTVQFVHRILAYLLTALVLVWAGLAIRWRTPKIALRAVLLASGLTLVQALVGILTVLYSVPIVLGVAHQGIAALLLTSVVYALLVLSPRKQQSE